jgi:glycosyltransferase involved in cell wall biosynthesis
VRVLFVNNHYQLGGAETVVQQLRQAFPGSRLVVPSGKHLPAHVETLYPRLLGRAYYSRLHQWVESVAPQARWTDRAFRELVKDPADIIHLHNFHGNYASVESLAFVAARKHIVWTFHGLWGVTGGCDHPKGCNRFLHQCGQCPQVGLWPIGSADKTAESLQGKIQHLSRLSLDVVAPSRYVADAIRRSQVGSRWRVHHIPNGIAAEKWTPIPFSNRKIDVLVVNRDYCDPHKGFSTMRSLFQFVESLIRLAPS